MSRIRLFLSAWLFLLAGSILSFAPAYAAEDSDEDLAGIEEVFQGHPLSFSANPAILERNQDTPLALDVTLPVDVSERVCVREATRTVYGPHPSCGYSWVPVLYCGGVRYPRYSPYYPYPYPYYYPGCAYVWERVMDSCFYPETYCAEYGLVTSRQWKTVRIRFRKNTQLHPGETETFELSASQRFTDKDEVDFVLKPINTRAEYKIKAREFPFERIVVKKKR